MANILRTTSLIALFTISTMLNSANYYWVGNGGDWSDNLNHWATTSGGQVFWNQAPGMNDDVFFDSNSFTLPGEIVNLDSGQYSCRSMNWTGVLNSPVFGDQQNMNSMNATVRIFGDLILDTGVTWGFIGLTSLEAPGNAVINTFDIMLFGVEMNSATGNWTLASNYRGYMIRMVRGTFNTANYDLYVRDQFLMNGTNPTTFNAGTSNVRGGDYSYLNSTVATLNVSNCTYSSGTLIAPPNTTFRKIILVSTIVQLAAVGANLDADSIIIPAQNNSYETVLAGGGCHVNYMETHLRTTIYGTYTFDTATIYNDFMTDDDITFGELHLNNPGYACKLKNGKVATLTGTITTGGGCVGFVNLISTLAGSTATISKASGTVTVSNLSLRDITATGGATFIANNSIIQSNVNGWTVNTVTNRTLYWVGGTGNWNDMVHWSLSSGGSGGECPPTQADDTRFDSQSFSSATDTLYIDVLQAACRNFDMTGNTLPIAISNTASAAGGDLKTYGNVLLSSGLNWNYNGSLVLSSSMSNSTVNTNRVALGPVTVSCVGVYSLLDSIRCGRLALNTGTFNTNNYLVRCGRIESSQTSSVMFRMGTSIVRSSEWYVNNTGFSADADSAILHTGALTQNGGPIAFHHVYMYGFSTLSGVNTTFDYLETNGETGTLCTNCSMDKSLFRSRISFGGVMNIGNAECRGDVFYYNSTPADSLTFNNPGHTVVVAVGAVASANNLFLNGSCQGYITLQTDYDSIPATISVPSGIVNGNYVYIKDINATGGATFNAANSLIEGVTSGWNLLSSVTSQTFFWIAGSGDWSDANHWSLTSGGGPSGCVPFLTDDVVFDNNSFLTANDTVNFDMNGGYCRNMTWTNTLGNPVAIRTNFTNYPYFYNIYGSLAIEPNVLTPYSGTWFLKGSGNKTINAPGVVLPTLILDNEGGSWSLLDSINCVWLQLLDGNFSGNGYDMNCGYMFETNDSTNIDNSTINSFYFKAFTPPADFSADSSHISCTYFEGYGQAFDTVVQGFSSFPEFYGQGVSIHEYSCLENMRFYNADLNHFDHAVFVQDAEIIGRNTFGIAEWMGAVQITGANSFDTIILRNAGSNIVLPADSVQTLTGTILRSTVSTSGINFMSSIPGTASSISCIGDSICLEYMSFTDITNSGTVPFYAGFFSVDGGNNSNLTFAACVLPMNIVWPGDANNDTIVDNNDLLNIGLAFNEAGPPRPGATINWVADTCVQWNRVFNSGSNINRADCDGNGLIDSTDLAAVYQNYGLTHPPVSPVAPPHVPNVSPMSVNADLYLDPVSLTYNPGDFVSIPVRLGNSTTPVTNIYGIAYKLSYDSTKLVQGTPTMLFPSNWFTPTGNRISLQLPVNGGQMDAAQSRTNLVDVSGDGIIAYLNFYIDSAAMDTLPINLFDVHAVDSDGDTVPLNVIGTVLTITNPASIETVASTALVNIFPNPSQNSTTLTVINPTAGDLSVRITDVNGNIVIEQAPSTFSAGMYTFALDTKSWASGMYFCSVYTEGGVTQTRFIILH